MKLSKLKKQILQLMPSKYVIKKEYKDVFNKKLNLKKPTTFNEKIQWLKLYDKNNDYTRLVDKVLVRTYVENLIGSEFLIPIIGVFKTFDDINFDSLPSKFVIKTNNSSGGVVPCLDKTLFDADRAKKIINEKLHHNFYKISREYPYKHIKPCIIVEEFIGSGNEYPYDYKILCFNGAPDNIMVCVGRETGNTKFYFFDLNWRLLRYNKQSLELPLDFKIPKPKNFDKMISIARELSKGIPLLRVDLYNVDGKLYFGELTFYPDGGFDSNLLPEFDLLLGNKLIIPKEKKR